MHTMLRSLQFSSHLHILRYKYRLTRKRYQFRPDTSHTLQHSSCSRGLMARTFYSIIKADKGVLVQQPLSACIFSNDQNLNDKIKELGFLFNAATLKENIVSAVLEFMIWL